MKKLTNTLFLLFFFLSFAQDNQSHYKTEIDFGNGTVFSTFLDLKINQKKFNITSPKNADVRMFGGKARIGRLLGKSPKKGIIISIAGKMVNDSLLGQTKIPVFGKLNFKGVIKDNVLTGIFVKDKSREVGSLNGIITDKKSNNYNYLYQKIIDTIQNNIYSKSAIETPEWKGFQKNIQKLCATAKDDIEMFLGFNMLGQTLPFTHLNLIITQNSTETSKIEEEEMPESVEKSVVFEIKSPNTVYLHIKNFSTSKDELATILPKIIENQSYKNLIIDLRNNGGGGIDAAFELAKYITNTDMEVGYFVTNKLQYSRFQSELFNKLPELQPKSTNEFGQELKKSSGVKLIFKKPSNPIFEGKIYVLTNSNTASTCEPIVYSLKNNKKAIIIGEKTYGGMLAASPFVISGKFTVMLPIADFYTYDGVRLDKVGVTPDIVTKPEDALNRALEIISSNLN